MSKTLASILTIAAVIAIQAIPGVGQAVGAAIAGTIGIGATTAATAVAIAQIAVVGLGAIAQAIIGNPGAPKPQATETAIKHPRPPRVSGYGEGRQYLAYMLYVTDRNGSALDVGAIHDGKINAILQIYLGDAKVTIGSGNWVQQGDAGAYGKSDVIRVYTRMGAALETAYSEIVSRVPDQWTAEHRGDGIASVAVIFNPVKAKDFQKIYPAGGPAQMPASFAMQRQLVFDWRDPTQSVADPRTWKYSENAVLARVHYELVRRTPPPTQAPSSPGYWAEIAANYTEKWNRRFAPTLEYLTAAANDCDVAVPLKGVQTILTVEAEHDAGAITVSSVNGLAAGMTIVVSATGDTSLTETRTVSSITGLVLHFSPALANDHPLGSQVSWSSSAGTPATEPRYRACVAHQHTDPHKGVIANLLACFDGWEAPRADGALIVRSGRYYAPTVEIGPDLILSYSDQDGIAEEEVINQISVTYVSSNHDYNVVDTDAWEDEDDISTRGKVLSDDLSNQVPSHSQARRLAKRKMSQILASRRGMVEATAGARIMLGERYIMLRLADAGSIELYAPVEVVQPVKRDPITGKITFNWILADTNIDSWNPATEEGEPAPVGNRIASAPLAVPTITGASPVFATSTDGGTGVRIEITATGPDRADLTWYARWRAVGQVSWNEAQYTDLDPGPSVTLDTVFVPTNTSIEVEVAYQTGDGRVSDWSDEITVGSATDAVAPDNASTITLVSWTDAINLTTDMVPRASSYRWRFYAADGTTLKATVITATRTVSYSAARAALDGVLRSYIVEVAGVNSAGAGGAVRTGILSNPAPVAITGFSMAGGATEAVATFSLSADPDVAGYVVYSSTASGFDPLTAGTAFYGFGTPLYLQNLAAGSFYAKMAAFDAWSNNPALLNFTSESGYTITTGGGGVGGGGGGGGGGYCPTLDTPILMANEARDGPGATKLAGEIAFGDYVWTQHEVTMEWGAYPVTYYAVTEDEVLSCDMGSPPVRATAAHLFWLSGWVRMDAMGTPCGSAKVAKITVDEAHTYVSAGVLSHNKLAEPSG